jgi:DNA polymerase III epsilon subunit-like protein
VANRAYCATHLNGNLMCAIDCETTGLQYNKHDIIQIAIIPVTPGFEPNLDIDYFHCFIKPRRPENIDLESNKVNRGRVVEAINNGMEPDTAEERLREWFAKLNLPFKKGIVPLGSNYAFDRDFIMDWLGGPLSYQEFFRNDYRDTMLTALMLNDMAAWAEDTIPFPKTGLAYLCNLLGVEHPNAHDAVGDCLATIEAYRRLMKYRPGRL